VSQDVGLLDHGEAIWVTQRPEPYTNCMFAAVCVVLSFMGYDLPTDFVAQLRKASGVDPEKPTSTANTRTALKKLIDDCPIEFGGLDRDVLLRRLADGEIVARIELKVDELPLHHPVRKHFKPTFHGGHAVALGGAERKADGTFDVLWMDPMGRPVNKYKGFMVPFSIIENALRKTPTGKIKVTFGRRDAALPEQEAEVNRNRMGAFAANPLVNAAGPEEPVVLTRGRPNEFANVPARTPLRHPVTGEIVMHTGEVADYRLAGRTTDRKFAGIWVNTRRIEGSRGPTLLIVDRELIGVPFIKPG
jgi:hypothetical protein